MDPCEHRECFHMPGEPHDERDSEFDLSLGVASTLSAAARVAVRLYRNTKRNTKRKSIGAFTEYMRVHKLNKNAIVTYLPQHILSVGC